LTTNGASGGRGLPVTARYGILILLLAGSLGLRSMRCHEGLPYLHEWDEPQSAGTALRILQTGDYNPHFFNYGSFMIYAYTAVDALHFVALTAFPGSFPSPLASLDDIVTEHDTGWHWSISHPSFILWNRYLVALMGTVTVLLACLIASRIGGPWAGVTAAAFLGVLDFHVYHSSIVTPNVPAAMLVTLACWAAFVHLDRPAAGFLLVSFAVCGLAVSTKYNAAPALVIPWTALFLSWGRDRGPGRRRSLLYLGIVLPPMVFLLTTPFAVLDLPVFLRAAGGEVRHYFIRGQGPATIAAGWPHAWHQLATIHATAGSVFCAAAAAGAVAIARRRAGWLLLCFPVCYFIYMTRSRIAEPRNLVVLYPFLAVAAGVGAVTVAGLLLSSVPWSRPVRRAAHATLVVIVVVALSALGAPTLARSWNAWAVRESRSSAIDVMNALMAGTAGGNARVDIASELRIHEEDLRRLEAQVEVAPYEELCRDGSARYDLVLGATRWRHDLPEDAEKETRMNAATPAGMRALETLGSGRWTHLTFSSNNPGLVIYGGAPG